ncbi:hypothetical protein [Streptomyces sp. YKOK-I1]
MPTLILLGAAGGALRTLLDVYARFLDWQAARRGHRQTPNGNTAELPVFRDYFDPVADPVAAVVHSAMGAGAAVLFGTTGQVSGAYAAVVVGISAPVILTQLGRVQSVSDAVTGGPGGSQPGPGPAAATADIPAHLGVPTQVTTSTGPEPPANGRPVDPSRERGSGFGSSHRARRQPQGPAVGEEGMT